MNQSPSLRRLHRDEPAESEATLLLPAHDEQVGQRIGQLEKDEPTPTQRPPAPAPARREPYALD
jgi:hypothetical protein